jgi:hypothetical protein
MRTFDRLLAASLALAAACSSTSPTIPPAPVDHDAQGSWGQSADGQPVPGSSFMIAIHESAGVIAGTGTYSGEAGPYGALAVSGSISRGSLRLSIVFVPQPSVFPQLTPDTAQFAGVLTSRDRIDGTLTHDNVTSAFGLVRLAVGDPP